MIVDCSKSNWASVDGPSSGNLNYDNGNGEKDFTIEVTPDDSVEANSQNSIYIEGKDGNLWKCRQQITVTVGQSRGASMSLGNTALYDIAPGQDRSTTLTVTNEGNGPTITPYKGRKDNCSAATKILREASKKFENKKKLRNQSKKQQVLD